jgi:hypothetical protein
MRHDFNPAEKNLCVLSTGRYRTTSHEQALRNFVLFRRHLAACRLALAVKRLAHELMNFGAFPALAGLSLPRALLATRPWRGHNSCSPHSVVTAVSFWCTA